MPRDSSGNYTLPAGNPVVGGTVITPTWANPTMSDIGAELTNSLDRNGRGGMLAPFKFADGTLVAPGMTWNAEPTSGFFRAGGNDMQAVIAGVPRMRWTASSVDVWDTGAAAWLPIIGPLGSNFALTNSPNVFTVLSTNTFNALTTFNGLTAFNAASTFNGQVVATGTAGSGAIRVSSVNPAITLTETDAAADAQNWRARVNGSAYTFALTNDVFGAQADIFIVTRAVMAVTQLRFGNVVDNPTYVFFGTGNVTFNGTVVGVAGTWSGAHTFTNGSGIAVSSATPMVRFVETDSPANGQKWRHLANGGNFVIEAMSDDELTNCPVMTVGRTTTTINSVSLRTGAFPGNIRFLLTETGTTISNVVTADSFTATNANPHFRINESDVGVNVKAWNINPVAGVLTFSTLTDAFGAGSNFWTITRGTTNVTSLSFGNAADNPTFNFLGTGIITSGGVYRGPDGVVGTPSYSFNSEPTSGMFRDSASSVAISVLGATRFLVRVGSVIITAPQLFNPDGTALLPAVAFLNDQDTGMYLPGANSIAWAVGGVARMSLASSGVITGIVADNTLNMELRATSHLMRLYADSGGTSFIQTLNIAGAAFTPLAISASTTTFDQGGVSAPSFTTISSRDKKRVTGAPRKAWDILSRLRPILYRMLAGDDREQLGLIAEEVHEVCPQLSDGKTVAYDRLALLLLAAWQDERAP